MHFLRYVLFGLILISGQNLLSQSTTIGNIEKGLQSKIQIEGEPVPTYPLRERMEHYKVPGLSVAIIKAGEIQWTRSYGLADTETGQAVEPQTLFQAASISKPVSAVAVLQLVEEGKIDLDTDVNQYLRSWKLPDNAYMARQPVTIRQLLSHTAGTSVSGFPGYTQEDEFPGTVQVLDGEGNTASVRVDTVPGTRYSYSGGGYTILQQLVEDVSGQSFATFAQQRVLEPIGMSNSAFRHPLPAAQHAQASAAYDGEGQMIAGKWHNYPELAAAGLWTTATDLARFAIELHKIYTGKKDGVLSNGTLQVMLSEVMNGYGLGLGTTTLQDGDIRFGHGGSNEGYKCHLLAFAQSGNGVVIMTNADRGYSLLQELELAVQEEYGWDVLEPERVRLRKVKRRELNKLKGSYKYEEQVEPIGDYYVKLRSEGRTLVIEDPNEETVETLHPIERGGFINLDGAGRIEFERGSNPLSFIWNGNFRFIRQADK